MDADRQVGQDEDSGNRGDSPFCLVVGGHTNGEGSGGCLVAVED